MNGQTIPDGEPMHYGRDFVFAEAAAEANLKITATRWLQGEPVPPIPYDEMRRLCGLPDVSAYIAQRDRDLAWKNMTTQLGEVIQHVATVWTEAIDQMLPGLRSLNESMKPKHKPPMWAVTPGRSRRTKNRATDIRTPYQ